MCQGFEVIVTDMLGLSENSLSSEQNVIEQNMQQILLDNCMNETLAKNLPSDTKKMTVWSFKN